MMLLPISNGYNSENVYFWTFLQRSTPKIDLDFEEPTSPKLEMENAAVNKAMSKVAPTASTSEVVPTSPVKSTSQMITGDLGRMCSIM